MKSNNILKKSQLSAEIVTDMQIFNMNIVYVTLFLLKGINFVIFVALKALKMK
jgi:hypothetical protein